MQGRIGRNLRKKGVPGIKKQYVFEENSLVSKEVIKMIKKVLTFYKRISVKIFRKRSAVY